MSTFVWRNIKLTQLARKKKALPLLENIEITDVAAEGKAIAKVDDLVIFIPWTAPGDIVDIQLTRKKRNFAEGRAIKFHHYAETRITPFCEHFTICGGCKWQHLEYQQQLHYKEKQVNDNLTRIGKVPINESAPIVGAEKQTYYRNKLEFTFSNRRWLKAEEIKSEEPLQMNGVGFHIPGMFDKVLDLNTCWLQNELSNRIRETIKTFCITQSGYPFFDLRQQEGFVRTLIIRTSSVGETMVIVVFFHEDLERRSALLQHLKESFPEITSLMYVINEKCNDTITDQTVHLFNGKDHLIEEMEELQFKIGPKSFYQTNSEQAYELYKIVREFADLHESETVYDLYTGIGTIANFVARNAKQVIGIEYIPEAIEDAKVNSKLNKINNTRFFAGDMKDILNDAFIAENGRPDVIITDPPRAGMHDDVLDMLLATKAERIVYVSCNPATQARDLNKLLLQYDVVKVQPVDMFPHTHHVENVALLHRRE